MGMVSSAANDKEHAAYCFKNQAKTIKEPRPAKSSETQRACNCSQNVPRDLLKQRSETADGGIKCPACNRLNVCIQSQAGRERGKQSTCCTSSMSNKYRSTYFVRRPAMYSLHPAHHRPQPNHTHLCQISQSRPCHQWD